MRLVIARCSVDYAGRLSAHLPLATRLLMLKADGSLLVHSDGGSYKPLNWMKPPCSIEITEPDDEQSSAGITQVWTVTQKKTQDKLIVSLYEVVSDETHDLGVDPGLVKDGVEAHLQQLLAEQIELLGDGHTLVRREYMTAIGPVDILARDDAGASVAVEMKRNANIDAVEQLTRYLEAHEPRPAPASGAGRTGGADRGTTGAHPRRRPRDPRPRARLRRDARHRGRAHPPVLSGPRLPLPRNQVPDATPRLSTVLCPEPGSERKDRPGGTAHPAPPPTDPGWSPPRPG